MSAHFEAEALLKSDLLGQIHRGWLTLPDGSRVQAIQRDVRPCAWWTRPLASYLLAREARALAAVGPLADEDHRLPRALWQAKGCLVRSWIEGRPLYAGGVDSPAYFASARRLLARLHRQGITHNDTAKEPNWLVTPEGLPALIDFQLAALSRRRGRFFRMLGREDLRHLLKHKRTYCKEHLSPRERALLANPSGPSRALRRLAKPLYNFITRTLLGWRDREGRGPR